MQYNRNSGCSKKRSAEYTAKKHQVLILRWTLLTCSLGINPTNARFLGLNIKRRTLTSHWGTGGKCTHPAWKKGHANVKHYIGQSGKYHNILLTTVWVVLHLNLTFEVFYLFISFYFLSCTNCTWSVRKFTRSWCITRANRAENKRYWPLQKIPQDTIIRFVGHSTISHKYCFQLLLGPF